MWPFRSRKGKTVDDTRRDAQKAIDEAQPVIAESNRIRKENHVYLLIREALR